MRELKYKKPLWYGVLAAGSLIAIAAIVLLILRLTDGKHALIPLLVLAAAAFGGEYLVFLGVRALQQMRDLPEQEKDLTAARPRREQATRALAETKSGLDRKFGRSLSAVILVLCAFLFLWAYGKAQKTQSIAQSTVITGVKYEKGTVVSIDDSQYQGQQAVEDVPVGKQIVTVEITRGDHEGNRYQLKNDLSYLYGTVLEEGDSVTVYYDGNLIGTYEVTAF